MADRSPNNDLGDRAERTSVPVRADCGHAFPISLAHLRDGTPFQCPSCGQTDRIDEDAVAAAKGQLEALARSGDPELAGVIAQILARVGGEQDAPQQ